MDDEINLNAEQMQSAVEKLYAAYAEADPEARITLLEQAVTDDVGHWTRNGTTTGRAALSVAIDR